MNKNKDAAKQYLEARKAIRGGKGRRDARGYRLKGIGVPGSTGGRVWKCQEAAVLVGGIGMDARYGG